MKAKAPSTEAERILLTAKATHIQKLIDQRDKALSLVRILQSSRLFTEATRREKLDEMRRLAEQYPVRSLSSAFLVARGIYYNDVLRAKGENAWYCIRRRELAPEVERIFADFHGAYGAEMIALKLKQEGNGADPHTVACIMSELGLVSSRNTSKRAYAQMRRQLKNRLHKKESDFTVSAPNRLWVCDATEFHYERIKFYLCAVVDVYARALAGYSIGVRNCTRLVIRAFLNAYENRKPEDGLVFHTDRGSTNLSRRFMERLRDHHVIQSSSRPHVPQDNSVIEAFFRNLKAEVVYPCHYRSQKEMSTAILDWLERYNSERPHLFNRGKTPNTAETEFYAKSTAIKGESNDPRRFDSIPAHEKSSENKQNVQSNPVGKSEE